MGLHLTDHVIFNVDLTDLVDLQRDANKQLRVSISPIICVRES